MNRGLAIALILLALVITLVCANAAMVADAVAENTAVIEEMNEAEPPTLSELSRARAVFEGSRFLLSVSVPLGFLEEYERSLRYMESAIMTKNRSYYVKSRLDALAALEQIKRSAIFSSDQLF